MFTFVHNGVFTMSRYALPAVAIASIAGVGLYLATSGPRVGKIYVRPAYDSVRVATVLHAGDSTAGTVARRLVTDLLTRDLRVRLDHVGGCTEIGARYEAEADSFHFVRPVELFDPDTARCFSYTVEYDVPLSEPMMWQTELVTAIPLRLSLIHPRSDFDNFRTNRFMP